MANLNLIFRFDDFMLRDAALNGKIVRIFLKHEIPIVLAVVPCDEHEISRFDRNDPFLEEIIEKVRINKIEIAQHGLNHVKSVNGELGKLPKEEQFRRITKGKEILEVFFRTNIHTFIPPWNVYDVNTLKVLEESGIKNISSALCIGQPFSKPNINYYPHTIDNLSDIRKTLQRNKFREGTIVVMLHDYDFANEENFGYLENLLGSIKKMKQVNCLTFKDMEQTSEVFDEKRMLANMGNNNIIFRIFGLKGVLYQTKFIYTFKYLSKFLKN